MFIVNVYIHNILFSLSDSFSWIFNFISDILIVARNIKYFDLLAMRKACDKHKEKRQIFHQHHISPIHKLDPDKKNRLFFLQCKEYCIALPEKNTKFCRKKSKCRKTEWKRRRPFFSVENKKMSV